MKRFAQSVVIISILAFALTQCQEDIQIDFSDFKPKLVVSAQLTTDQSFSINIAESASPVSSEPGKVPDELTLELTDVTLDVNIALYRENDIYIAQLIYPRPGHMYELVAEAPGIQKVITRTTIPRHRELRKIEISNATMTPSETTAGKNNVSYDLQLTLDTEHDRYLHVIFWQSTKLNVGPVEEPDIEEFVYLIAPEYPEESGFQRHHEFGVLIDRESLESPRQLMFSFRDYTINAFEELGDLTVEVRTISPGYYLYFDSLARQLITRKDPLAEPIPTYNNVEGGLGNFSAFSTKLYRVQLFL